MKKKFKYLLYTIAFFGLLFSSKNVFADEETGSHFLLGPTSQRMTLEPGKSYRSSVYISNPNTSTSDVKLTLYVAPYGIINDQYDPTFDQETTYTQIKDWIILDKKEVTISPNQKIDVGFTINVPDNAPAGGQYATIIAQKAIEEGHTNGINITDIAAIGSVLVAEIAGETHDEGVILDNSIPSFLLSGPLQATSLVRNDGNVHTDAEYTLQVWPLLSNEEICTNEEEPSKSLIMPETERFHVETCNLPAIGIFRAKQTVQIFGETIIKEKLVFICPLWLLVIIIFAIILLVMWLITRAKAKNKE